MTMTLEQKRAIALANARARAAGYTDAGMDVLKSAAGGVVGAAANMVDSALTATPLVGWAASTAGSLMKGRAPRFDFQGTGSLSRPTNSAMTEASAPISGYRPQTTAGEWAKTGATMAPNVFLPGTLAQRAANVALPWLASEGTAQAVKAFGGNDTAQDVGRTVGAVAGGGLASLRPPNIFNRQPLTAAELFGQRTKLDPAKAQAAADEMRAAGVEPTMIDVAGERGRRVLRAAGVKSEDAGAILTKNANARAAVAKPAVMSRARSVGPFQGQTAEDTKTTIINNRETEANTKYAPAYAEPISVTSETLDALSGEPGRLAMQEARKVAVARQNREQIAELDALMSGKKPPTQVSGATLDRIRIAYRELADAASRNSQQAYASGLMGRKAVIDQTLDKAPGLLDARAAYRAKSQAIGVLGKDGRDPFTTDPADYARWLQSLPEEARNANQVAIRQRVLDMLGKQKEGGSLGTLDTLSTSPYATANLRAALGQAGEGLISEAAMRASQARNANFVQPNAGSRTAVLQNDIGEGIVDAAKLIGHAKTGNVPALLQWGINKFYGAGIKPQQAEELARMAVDPAQTDQAIAAIAARLNPAQRQALFDLRNAALQGGMALSRETGRASASDRRFPQ